MAKLPGSAQIVAGVHRAAQAVLKQSGFQWELRRHGDVSLGLWRRKLGQKSPHGSRKTQSTKKIILVPGFGDSPLSWLSVVFILLPVLKKNYGELILLDFPGFQGCLAKEKCFVSMDLLFEAVADTFDSLQPHTILGHSLGGWIAGHYGVVCGKEERPKNSRRHYLGPEVLVLMNPSGVFGPDREKQEFEQRFLKSIQEGFAPLRKSIFAKEPLWFRFFIDHFNEFIQRQDTAEFVRSVKEDHSLENELKHLKAQLWLIWGELDTLVPAKWIRHWLKELDAPHHQVHGVFLKKVGHSPQLEKPAVLAALLGQILLGKKPHPAGRIWWKEVTY